jgi:large subunit ribosomal protein L30
MQSPEHNLSSGQLLVTQTKSGCGRKPGQQACLVGLGLNKPGRSRVLRDTPETRGMLRKVAHLVSVKAPA